jgi:hypothetical protein
MAMRDRLGDRMPDELTAAPWFDLPEADYQKRARAL